MRHIRSQRPAYHQQPAGRGLEVLAGLACSSCGVGLAILGGFGLFALLVRDGPAPTSSTVLFTLTICALAALFLVLGWRLVLNRARPSDGGLFSPLGLRMGGLVFLAGPVAVAFTHPVGLFETGFAFAASASCFALARHREHRLSSMVPPAA